MVLKDIHVCDFTLELIFFSRSYGEPCIRRVVPLALAMLSASNPKLEIIDTLSKLSHDSDSEVSVLEIRYLETFNYLMRLR